MNLIARQEKMKIIDCASNVGWRLKCVTWACPNWNTEKEIGACRGQNHWNVKKFSSSFKKINENLVQIKLSRLWRTYVHFGENWSWCKKYSFRVDFKNGWLTMYRVHLLVIRVFSTTWVAQVIPEHLHSSPFVVAKKQPIDFIIKLECNLEGKKFPLKIFHVSLFRSQFVVYIE